MKLEQQKKLLSLPAPNSWNIELRVFILTAASIEELLKH